MALSVWYRCFFPLFALYDVKERVLIWLSAKKPHPRAGQVFVSEGQPIRKRLARSKTLVRIRKMIGLPNTI